MSSRCKSLRHAHPHLRMPALWAASLLLLPPFRLADAQGEGEEEEAVCEASAGGCGAPLGNLCVRGKLSPELLVLGAEKAGSTSLCEMLSESPGIVFSAEKVHASRVREDGKRRVKKEAQLFSNPLKFEKFGLRFFPACTEAPRRVAVDCSPQYLYTPGTTQRILDWYGQSSSRLTFLVQLRDPVKRFQSSFQFWRRTNANAKIAQFADCARRALEDSATRPPPSHAWMENCDMNLNRTMYAEQLARYLEAFSPRQLIVVPMSYTVAPGQGDLPDVPEFVWRRLGVDLPGSPRAVLHETRNDHAAIEDDLGPALLSSLRALLDGLTGAGVLAGMLAAPQEGAAVGPTLYGYDGPPSDREAIAAWLAARW